MSNLHCTSILLSRSNATVKETLWHRLQHPGAAPARTARRWAPAPARAAPWAPWRRRRPPPPRAAPARPAPGTPASCRCLRFSQHYALVLHITCISLHGTAALFAKPRRPSARSGLRNRRQVRQQLATACAAPQASGTTVCLCTSPAYLYGAAALLAMPHEAHLRQAAVSASCLQPRRQPVTSACPHYQGSVSILKNRPGAADCTPSVLSMSPTIPGT